MQLLQWNYIMGCAECLSIEEYIHNHNQDNNNSLHYDTVTLQNILSMILMEN